MDKISGFIPDIPNPNWEQHRKNILNQPDIKSFIESDSGITPEIIERDFSRLNEFYHESRKEFAKDQQGLILKPHLTFEESFIHCSYIPVATNLVIERNKRRELNINPSLYFDEKTTTFKDVYFDDVEVDEYNILIKKSFEKFVANYEFGDSPKGIWLHGKFGRGKSYLLGAFANELYKEKHAGVHFISLSTFAKGLQSLFGEQYKMDDLITKVKTAEFLILDDLGTENGKDWLFKDVLYEGILEYRMSNELPTFFSSNYTQKEYEEFLKTKLTSTLDAERIMERITFLSKEVYLGGINRRVKA